MVIYSGYYWVIYKGAKAQRRKGGRRKEGEVAKGQEGDGLS